MYEFIVFWKMMIVDHPTNLSMYMAFDDADRNPFSRNAYYVLALILINIIAFLSTVCYIIVERLIFIIALQTFEALFDFIALT